MISAENPRASITNPIDSLQPAASSTKTFDGQPAHDIELIDLALELFTLSYRTIAIAEDVRAENNRP